MAEKTTYIILRKIPFQDSSLIVSGLSPEFGRLDFLLRGVRGTGAKKFPYAELFRELAIEFRPPKLHSPGTMCNLTSHELIASFDSIALRIENYLRMCAYAAFLLKHTKPMLEIPGTCRALEVLLSRLTVETEPDFPVAAAKLMFLQESGFVPEAMGTGGFRREQILDSLLEYAVNPECPAPDLTEEYRRKLIRWINELCDYHDLH